MLFISCLVSSIDAELPVERPSQETAGVECVVTRERVLVGVVFLDYVFKADRACRRLRHDCTPCPLAKLTPEMRVFILFKEE